VALEGKVTIPVFGEVDKKYAVVGAVAAGGIVAVVYIRKRKAASASAAATTAAAASTATDPAGNVGAIDPATGYVYGSPEDTQMLSSAAGTGTGYYNTSGGGGGGFGNIDPITGYPVGSIADETALGSSGTNTAPGSGVTSNTQWLTEASGMLPGDTSTITTALASVLGGLTVTTAQKNLFMEAVGILGPPPGGYPSPIKTSDTSAQPAPTPTPASGGGGTAPHAIGVSWSTVGQTLAQARSTVAAHGFHVNNVSGNQAGHVVSQTAYSDNSVNLGMN
jgi:hypothetical protein